MHGGLLVTDDQKAWEVECSLVRMAHLARWPASGGFWRLETACFLRLPPADWMFGFGLGGIQLKYQKCPRCMDQFITAQHYFSWVYPSVFAPPTT